MLIDIINKNKRKNRLFPGVRVFLNSKTIMIFFFLFPFQQNKKHKTNFFYLLDVHFGVCIYLLHIMDGFSVEKTTKPLIKRLGKSQNTTQRKWR